MVLCGALTTLSKLVDRVRLQNIKINHQREKVLYNPFPPGVYPLWWRYSILQVSELQVSSMRAQAVVQAFHSQKVNNYKVFFLPPPWGPVTLSIHTNIWFVNPLVHTCKGGSWWKIKKSQNRHTHLRSCPQLCSLQKSATYGGKWANYEFRQRGYKSNCN